MQAHSSSKHFNGRGRRPVEQQLRSPRKVIVLARIQFRGALILVLGGKGVIEFFIEIPEQVMQIRFVRLTGILRTCEHSTHLLARAHKVSGSIQSQSESERVRAITWIYLIGSLQQRDCLAIFPRAKIERTETMIRFKAPRS